MAALKWHLGELVRALGALIRDAIHRVWLQLREAAAEGPRALLRRSGILVLRAAGAIVASLLAFVLLTALVAAHDPGGLARWTLGFLMVVLAPLVVSRLWFLRERRGVVTAWNLLLAITLVAVCGRALGGTVRRHGDWFLGQRTDASAARLRGAIGGTAALLEWFTPPTEMRSHELPLELSPPYFGPWREGEAPYPPEPIQVRWVHPLPAAQRNLPPFESRRFGAVRPQPRPWECELGHCGVDLAAALGEPVVAVADGVIERVERNAGAGGRAGRFVRICHCDGVVVTRYIHLNTIRKDLHPGRRIAAGELLGTVGRTGVDENFPHLHFGLSSRASDGSERYLDPEPFLRIWELSEEAPHAQLPPLVIARR
jgi:murein DD-endopeptidase MepM/ murein hydrolase activator NlpD